MKQLVIFDLDGTLLNTIADLGTATNYALRLNNFPEHAIDEYNRFVGNGINKLFERALPADARSEENILRIREAFLPYYNEHNCDLTHPYDGMMELLKALQTQGMKLAVASNKYQAATEKLVHYFFPQINFVAIFGQRADVPLKPHPQVVEEIIILAHATTTDTLYVGDSDVDMQTAHNAGVEVVGVTWGFCTQSKLEACTPTYIVDSAHDILKLIR